MVLDLKFTRFENVPWGFRLTGGSDFELPLTVIKVTKGSIAEETGLKVGDVIVRINDTPSSNLSHSEAHEIIMQCANTFLFGVLRPDEDGCYENPNKVPAEENNEHESSNGLNSTNGNHGTPSPYRQFQTPDSQAYSDMSEMTIHTNHTESASDEVKTDEITDDHIAEMMSGEAEVLKEHNVIGVNFKRIIPKAGLFKSSEVFKHLNEEAMKTKADKDQETKKWTTFLQKPNRPIPKSRFDLEREKKTASGYKPIICKQPKPKCDPNRPPSPVAPEPEIKQEPEPEIELIPGPEPQYVEYLNEDVVDGDATNLEVSETVTVEDDQTQEELESEQSEEIAGTSCDNSNNTTSKTEEEIMIEKQLAEVQKQLLALSSLPSTIQATLDAVTKQLAELMPALKPTNQVIVTDDDIGNGSFGETDEEVDANDAEIDEMDEAPKDNESNADIVVEEIVDEEQPASNENDKHVDESIEDSPEISTQEEIEKQRMEKVFKKQEEEWLSKKEKELKRLEAEENAKRRFPRRLPKELGGPLTPQERPLVLPGGRKWRNERDAFNEEFIAEVISSQAELITGSTLGHSYESPLLPYDDRESNCSFLESKLNEINFLKYKKPEKDLSNLNRSEVFRIIHNIEKDPKHGIQVRPPKVLAEEDVRSRATPIHCA